MKTKSLSGQEIDLSDGKLDELKMRLQGEILEPGEDGYDNSRSVWNGMIDRRPAFVIGVAPIKPDTITCQ